MVIYCPKMDCHQLVPSHYFLNSCRHPLVEAFAWLESSLILKMRFANFLTHCGLVISVNQHWLRLWLGAWRHQVITWISVDVSLVKFYDIYLRAISQYVPKLLLCKMSLKFKHLWHQGSFCECTQPIRDEVTLQRCLSLAGRIHKVIPATSPRGHQVKFHPGAYWLELCKLWWIMQIISDAYLMVDYDSSVKCLRSV